MDESDNYSGFTNLDDLPEDYISVKGDIKLNTANLNFKIKGSLLSFSINSLDILACKSISKLDVKANLNSM